MVSIPARCFSDVPGSAVKTIFFNSTTMDYAGKAVEPGSEPVNFLAAREGSLTGPQKNSAQFRRFMSGTRVGAAPAPSVARSATPSLVGPPAPAAGRPTPSDGLTAYSQSYVRMPLQGSRINRLLREGAVRRARGEAKVPEEGTYSTCYRISCHDRANATGGLGPAFADVAAFKDQDNRFARLLGAGGGSEGPMRSFASTQHAAPPKEMKLDAKPCVPLDHLGQVPKASSFFASQSQRVYVDAAFAQAPPPLQRVASAPSGLGPGGGRLRAAAEDLGPERVFRRAMMTSQYRETHSSAGSGTGGGR